ncbi:hypothetical protein ABIA39_007433 [Nocardia sp. GAS34]|uniref:helicase-associated domain-containing protein n=1 Tax=unclassified Nocardia TaxID=2637762 RepID=UPI003D1A340A
MVAPETTSTMRQTEQEALANVRAVLELAAAGQLRCSDKTSRPAAATVRSIAGALADGDFYPDEPISAFAWPLLLQAGGLATTSASKLQLTPKGRTALRKSPADVIAHLWRRWPAHAVVDEFSRIEHIKGQRSKNVLTAAKTRRATVASALEHCVPDDWIGIDELFRTMQRKGLHPTITRSDRARWKLYLVDPEYGSMGYSGYGDWPILEGRYTLAVLFEYAATLGLIDIDYTEPAGARTDYHHQWGSDDLEFLSRYDGLNAIQRTALGRYAIGLADQYTPAPNKRTRELTVLSNHDVVIGGDISAADRLLLSAHAEQTSDRVWTITTDSLLTAIDAGRRLADFMDFLLACSTKPLPDTLRVLIGDAEQRAGRLADLGSVRLIECADPATATLLARDRTLRTLCQPIGDRHLAIRPDRLPEFRRRLRARGHILPTPGTES